MRAIQARSEAKSSWLPLPRHNGVGVVPVGSDTRSKRRRLPGADALLALGIALAVGLLHGATDLVGLLERRFYDAASTLAAPPPSERIAVIAIDDASLERLGRWPWPRDIHARLIDRLAEARARVIVHTALFLEPQADRGQPYLERIRALAGPATPAGAVAGEALAALDTDTRLASSLAHAGNVLLPAAFTLGRPAGRPEADPPAFLDRSIVPEPTGAAVPALRAQFPLPALGAAAAGVGHLNLLVDPDGVARRDPLLLDLDGRAVPSLALLAVAASLNLGPSDIRVQPGHGLAIGRLQVPTDAQFRTLPQFYPPLGGLTAFPVDSFHEVLSGQVPAGRYAGRIVVIGPTAAGIGALMPAPGVPALSPTERLAHLTSSLLGGHSFEQPAWAPWATAGLSLLVVAYLAAWLPRLSAAAGASVTTAALVGFLGGEWVLLAGGGLWVPLVLPALLLVLGHLALTTRRFLVTEAGKRQADDESAEAHRMMGLALLGQGQLDMAFDRFRRVPLGPAVMDNLYQLALDFERRRQFNKAEAVYAHMAAHDAAYRDLPQRRERARRAAAAVVLGATATHPGGSLVLDDPTLALPTLGRYQLDKALGQGAMGMVYLGRDPKIGRQVAIKTLALGEAFEGEALVEARARFFREAETAGRLAHPHIVTIFDAGEEHDLAYIAMEYVPGQDLSAHARPGQLLPARQVVEMGLQVAQALDHAHRQQVVHRDIKPANLLWVPGTDTLKVTDFGIARLADSSRTRTGTLLGTPGFMAPEQIAGQPVDGRCDLYALGVTLFQLLTGTLPFEADSLTELMFKITQHDAPDLRSLRPDLPEALARILARALRKSPDDRYPDGGQMAADLQACLAAWPLVEVAPDIRRAA